VGVLSDYFPISKQGLVLDKMREKGQDFLYEWIYRYLYRRPAPWALYPTSALGPNSEDENHPTIQAKDTACQWISWQ